MGDSRSPGGGSSFGGLVLVALLGGGGYLLYTAYNNRPPSQVIPHLPELIGQLETQRSRAEQRAHTLKSDHQQGRLSDEEMQAAEATYREAKASFDGWVAEVETALRLGSADAEHLRGSLEAATQRCDAFVAWADRQHESPGVVTTDESSKGPAHEQAVNGILNVFFQVSREIQATGKRERDEVIDLLRRHQWKAFADVP